MKRDELSDFVRAALAAGESRTRIAAALQQAGWDVGEVRAALDSFAEVDFAIPVPRPLSRPSARESFLYLLLFTALYMIAISLGRILYQLIDLALPDPQASRYAAQGIEEGLRWGAAMLVVFLPVYLLIDRKIEVLKRTDPTHGRSGVRRWLTSLTLYVAALTLLSDAGYLLYALLNGELVLRVLLKGLVIGGIAGFALTRYLGEMRADEAAKHQAGPGQ